MKLAHDSDYIDKLLAGALTSTDKDCYFSEGTLNSILKAVGCLLSVVNNVVTGEIKSGFAMIRPPGHHAERDTFKGFCFVSNIAIAAKYILKTQNIKR